MKVKQFENYLVKSNLARNTIMAYLLTVKNFMKDYKTINHKNLIEYKSYLIDNYKYQTVNLRLQGLNKYLDFIEKPDLKLKFIKVQQRNFIEHVISDADYKYLKSKLKQNNDIKWYYIVWFLAATGARISELLQIKVEHLLVGYLDICSKGGKIRRIYIPKRLRTDALKWTKENNYVTGFLFLNNLGNRISSRGIASQLKHFAINYGLNPQTVYPHSFRHRFAKNFLEKYNDIALLADLMGHESIETTRIYLRKTSTEQQQIVDTIIDW